jgi:hypothetical protein
MNPRIIPLPSWLLFWCVAITFGRTVFIRRTYKDDPVVLAHETIHVLQYHREGFLKFLFLYAFALPVGWNPWRARWEAEAFAVNVRAGQGLRACADQIAGPSYLWPCSHEKAFSLLVDYSGREA